jgi:sugar lactone lactonase YvrE
MVDEDYLMTPRVLFVFALLVASISAFGQPANYPYVVKTFAGSNPLGDGGPATQALLFSPSAVALDGLGATYILDAANYRIRKVGLDGKISTVVQLPAYANDMKLGADGFFYLTSFALVFKVSPAGVVTILAGTGTPGTSADGLAATSAEIGATGGIALDVAGDVYFTDGNLVRKITADGIIHTVAGVPNSSRYNGDNKLATTATLSSPWGIALDSGNNLYIADQYNGRVRKVSNGRISTIAGTGDFAPPAPGPAIFVPLGVPYALTLDSMGNVYFTDAYFSVVMRITPSGSLLQVAGSQNFGYADGPSNASFLFGPAGMAVDDLGTVFVAEQLSGRVRQVISGNLRTFAGRLHYAGDGAAATSALLSQPVDLSFDGQGDVFIADSANFRVREVTPDGSINTYAGSGIAGIPAKGAMGVTAQLPRVSAMAADAKGNLYLAGPFSVLKIAAGGAVSTLAGGGSFGDTGDGGQAAKALFESVAGVAVDTSGNVYVADSQANRIRKISAVDGTIAAFAGSGKTGSTGDGGLATSATLNLLNGTPLAVDQKGNVYIGDGGNNAIRMVAPTGIISTVAGGGALGTPKDGATAKGALFSPAAGIAVDASGVLYITSQIFPSIYQVDSAGVIHTISGAGNAGVADGLPANSTFGFYGMGIHVDSNSDLYVADPGGNAIRKLIVNSPTGLAISDGNNQTAPAGAALPKALRVMVNGRAGVGVAGVTVNFAVTSGVATLSAPTSQTDNAGAAGVALTLGPAAGDVVVTAKIMGSNLPTAQFTVTASSSSLTVTPQLLAFSYNVGDPAPAAQTLAISVPGGGSVPFMTVLAVSGDVQWLQVDKVVGSTPASIQLSVVNLDMLAPGVYQGSVTLTALIGASDPQSVAVQLTITDPNAGKPSAKSH